MTIKGVLLRFLLIYSVLLLTVGFALQYVGVKSNSGASVGVLMGSIFWVCFAFGKKNNRYFTKGEKNIVVFGTVLIGLVIQWLATYAIVPISESSLMLNKFFLFGFAFIAVLHTAATYWAIGFIKNMLVKQGVISG